MPHHDTKTGTPAVPATSSHRKKRNRLALTAAAAAVAAAGSAVLMSAASAERAGDAPGAAAPTGGGEEIWRGEPERGTDVFAGLDCVRPGKVTAQDDAFLFDRPAGVKRCEARSVAADGGDDEGRPELGYGFHEGRTYHLHWKVKTDTADAGTVFQWKSHPNAQQNYPVLLKVEDGRLKLFKVAPGEQWNLAWSAPMPENQYKTVDLTLTTARSADKGRVALSVDGTQVAAFPWRTWDSLNRPQWGTYGAEVQDKAARVWLTDLRITEK
ncbi:hypothetical protein ACFQVC_08725 [Streptomyces monticola]|uniref:Polysaccharide lyase n=1 Tax=Streptomyces monticola TaxID=2666263 RepID=A0ABW2JFW8_9ACTN